MSLPNIALDAKKAELTTEELLIAKGVDPAAIAKEFNAKINL